MSMKLYENIENSFKGNNDMVILAKGNTPNIIIKQSDAENFIFFFARRPLLSLAEGKFRRG